MNTLSTATTFLSAELAIVVSLVVFASLTALLLTFIILLFACKRFRELFFPTNKKRKQKHNPKIDLSVFDENAGKKPQSPRSAKPKASAYYDNGIPTVPLNVANFDEADSEPATQKMTVGHVNTSFNKIPTVVINTRVPNTKVKPKTTDKPTTTQIKRTTSAATKTTAKTTARPQRTEAPKTKYKSKKQ